MKKTIQAFQILSTIIIISILFLFAPFIYAQGEGNNWYFGDNAALNFATDPPIIVSGSQMSTLEGCASISNQNGDLLFYTDGRKVWNRDNVQMPNGFDLKGDVSSTQSCVPVPHPGNSDLYYIFTTDTRNNNLIKGFNYSILDMSANGGMGDITEKNIRLLGSELVPEKVTAVKHGNEPAYWVITHGWEGSDASTFYVFKIDANGLNPSPQTYDIGRAHGSLNGDNSQARGYLKVSPDGELLACAVGENPNGNIELFDFNDLTGEISNYRTVGSGISDPYGLEFSPDGTKLYATSLIGKKLVQIDLSNGNQQTVLSSNDEDFELYGALQISPHGSIYMAGGGLNSGNRYLSGIINPDGLGTASNFQKNLVDLYPNTVHYGLPTFIQSFFSIPSFSFENTCLGDQTEFQLEIVLEPGHVINHVIWEYSDIFSAENIQTTYTDPYNGSHEFTFPDAYNVKVTVITDGGFEYTGRGNITITQNPNFSIKDINNVSQDPYQLCAGESMQFKVSPWEFESATWNNGASGETSLPYSEAQEISVEVTNFNGCSTTKSINLEMAPETIVFMELPSFCTGEPATDISTYPSLLGGIFSGDAIINSSGIIDPSLIPLGDSVLITYTYMDANNCDGTIEDWAVHFESPEVGFNLAETQFCQNAPPFFLSGGSPAGGFYSGIGVENGIFNPEIAGIGSFEIEYTYISNNACSNSVQQTVMVVPGPISAHSISVDINSFCQNDAPEMITLQCEGPNDSYYWYKDDLQSSPIANSKYVTIGAPSVSTEYFVRSESEDCGVSDALSILVEVFESPTAEFSVSNIYSGEEALFMDESISESTSIIGWEWDFGDGTSSNDQNPSHSYTNSGNYSVSLRITNSSGCQDIYTEVLEVLAEETIVSITPNNQIVYGSGIITTNIEIANVLNLGGFELELPFDTDFLQANSVVLEGFLESTGRTLFPLKDVIDNELGLIEFGIVTLGDNPPGPDGGGILLSIEWTVNSDLETETIVDLLLQNIQLSNPDGTPISFEIENASITINPCFTYDFDCDCDVDIIDITAAAFTYDSEEGDEVYNPTYDFDNDGDIDILDISMVAYHYGWSCNDKSQEKHSLFNTDNDKVELHIEEYPTNDGFLYYDIRIEEVDELGGFEFVLNYNPAELEILEIQENGFIGSTGRQVLELQQNIDNESGKLHYAITTLGSQTQGASGSGTLFRIKCKTHSSDITPPNLTEGQLARIDGELIPYEMVSTGLSEESIIVKSNRIISVSPNPFVDKALIHYSVEQETDIMFRIIDINARPCFETELIRSKAGNNNYSIDKINLNNGSYSLLLLGDGKVLDFILLVKIE